VRCWFLPLPSSAARRRRPCQPPGTRRIPGHGNRLDCGNGERRLSDRPPTPFPVFVSRAQFPITESASRGSLRRLGSRVRQDFTAAQMVKERSPRIPVVPFCASADDELRPGPCRRDIGQPLGLGVLKPPFFGRQRLPTERLRARRLKRPRAVGAGPALLRL